VSVNCLAVLLTVHTLLLLLQADYLEDDDYYIESNGRIITDEDNFVDGNNYYVRLRVRGGKGGTMYLLLYTLIV